MKVKQIIFGLLACLTLVAVSFERSNTASEDGFYEQGVDRTKIRKSNKAKDQVVSVDRTKIRKSNKAKDQVVSDKTF